MKDSRKILVVEDDPALSFVIAFSLKSEEYEILTASTGMDALRILGEQLISLLILDVTLPDTTAYKIIEKLRLEERSRHLPLIIHTSLDLTESDKKSLSLGPSVHVTKTFMTGDALVSLVKTMLNVGEAAR